MTTAATVPPLHTPDRSSVLPVVAMERRFEPRRPVDAPLWMIDHYGATMLRCRCVDVSKHGMRMLVPLGYGIAEGQRYELRSHQPSGEPRESLGLIGSRWGTIVRTELRLGDQGDCLEAGFVLDGSDPTYTPREAV